MPDIPEIAVALPAAREAESLFARGDDDALIRREKKTQADFDLEITLSIDGHSVTVPKATPATDAQGNIRLSPDGKQIPRATTIYDAASKLSEQLMTKGTWQHGELSRRIPILCHQDHLDPVAVCRMCSVHVSKFRKRDKGKPNARPVPAEKLVPACQHEVQEDMIVTTRCGGSVQSGSDKFAAQVARATGMLAELLVADHRHPDPIRDDRFRNELDEVADAMGIEEPRASLNRQHSRNVNLHPNSRPLPVLSENPFQFSSRSITVDHDRCILCDRCVRSCSEVKPFKVIGHTGKGYQTRISFDLDQIMDQSSCVQCGECMSACPTGALTLNRRVNPLGSWPDADDLERKARKLAPNYVPRTPDDARHPYPHLTVFNDPAVKLPTDFPAPDDYFPGARELRATVLNYADRDGAIREYRPFEDIPLPYLRWNEGGVRRREVSPGEVLCRKDDFGSTAFLLDSGSFEIVVGTGSSKTGGWLRRTNTGQNGERVVAVVHGGKDLITGEMACLTNTRRTATVRVQSAGTVYEVTRNMLFMIQRTRGGRASLDRFYVPRAVRDCVTTGRLFQKLTPQQREDILVEVTREAGDAELIRVVAGQTIVAEGDAVGRDSIGQHRGDLYIIRLGSAEVFRAADGSPRVLARLTRNDHFGEIALLAPELTAEGRKVENRRTATVRALDEVEVVRIRGDAFRRLLKKWPEIQGPLLEHCRQSLDAQKRTPPPLLGPYLSEGLFQGQQMLVLDLESCTRCDECTRACADAHGDGLSRLLREGPRFGKFLVATSCRSCHTPYCMEGCPVDAIHRGTQSLEVRIDSHCIGCGLCATNCPYESIQMAPRDPKGHDGRRVAAVAHQAVNCDLCQDLVPKGSDPFCVSACPHEAAFRWTGEKLYEVANRQLR